jgi:ribosome-binding factor A
MPKEFSRTRRIGEQIKRELAELIRDEIKDPRVVMVTVSAVDVSRDLGHAKVYFTTLDQEHKREDVVKVLNKASGFLRHELSRRLTTRTTPQLHFFYDESIEKGEHLSSLIESAVASDKSKSNDSD